SDGGRSLRSCNIFIVDLCVLERFYGRFLWSEARSCIRERSVRSSSGLLACCARRSHRPMLLPQRLEILAYGPSVATYAGSIPAPAARRPGGKRGVRGPPRRARRWLIIAGLKTARR